MYGKVKSVWKNDTFPDTFCIENLSFLTMHKKKTFILCIDNKVDFIVHRQVHKALLYISWTTLYVMENTLYVMEKVK